MKYMKKILFILITILGFTTLIFSEIKVYGEEMLEVDYNVNREMRAVWVSPLVSDVPRFTSEKQYKSAINTVLDNMEKMNLNVLIFHVRIMNDALYESQYNNWSSYYNTNPSWEALPWIIEECHNRGIEFHAWMNPYRVTSSSSGDLKTIASKFPKSNAASNPDNLIKGKSNIILNPGIPEVQNFLVNVCMEVATKYDIDAIHFDDYFYVENIDDNATYLKYGNNQGIENFRRESVNAFIKKLDAELEKYNQENNKSVELGISPTPVWTNGDGVVTYDEDGKAISKGSKGIGQGHYGNYLYCDTLLWVNEGWIDYILPQCYIGSSEGNILFESTVDWWSKVCRNSRTKLYIGIGIYRASSTGDWKNTDELYNQLSFMAKYDNIQGFSLYSYKHLVGSNQYVAQNLQKAKKFFSNKVFAPIIDIEIDIDSQKLKEYYIINNGSNHTIGVKGLDSAKYYIVLKKDNETYDLLDVIGESIECVDEASEYCEYYIAPIFLNNQVGEYVKLTTDDLYYEIKFYGENNQYLFSKYTKDETLEVFPEAPAVTGKEFVSWEEIDGGYKANYEDLKFKVTYLVNDEVYKEIEVKYGEDAPDLEFDSQYGKFSGWKGDFNNVIEDRTITSTYLRETCTLYYFNGSKIILKENHLKGDVITINKDIIEKDLEIEEGYKFDGFKLNGELVDSFVITASEYLYASFSKISYVITLNDNETKEVEFTDANEVKLPIPTKEGYKFLGWYEGDKKVEIVENRNYNLFAKWIKIYSISYDLAGGKCSNLQNEFEETFVLPIPTKEGYNFLGWYENDKKVEVLELKDYSLTAKWEKKSGCNNSLANLYVSLSMLLLIIVKKRSK